jgi:hypothetical protein
MGDWLEGVSRIRGKTDGGSMLGGPPRIVWHTYEAGYGLTADAGAHGLVSAGNEVHFVFHPVDGDLVQLLPASRAGRGLKNLPGGVQTNRMGSVCLQVEVIGRAAQPWTADLTVAGRRGLAELVDFARAHGIPDVWPAGPPPAYPDGFSVRSATTWEQQAGHYGHSQVPENDHGDPGAIDIRALFAVSIAATAAPIEEKAGMFLIRTPSNGQFAVWPDGDHMAYTKLQNDVADRWAAGGIHRVNLGALDATNLMHLQAAVQDTPPPIDLDALAAQIVALLPAGGVSAAEVATRTADLMAARLAS